GWFYKTQEEWTDEICLSRCEQETARRVLRAFNFWHEVRRGVPAKLYFRLDLDKLAAAVTQHAENPRSRFRTVGTQGFDNTANKNAENRQSSMWKPREHKEQRVPENTPEITQPDKHSPDTGANSPATSGKRRSRMSQGFAPKHRHKELATELGIDLDRSFAAFSDYHASKGNTFVDWDRALNTWLRNEERFAHENGKRHTYNNAAQRRQANNISAAEEAVSIIERRMAR